MADTTRPQAGRGGTTLKRPARWVDDEMARLDPETDYARIVQLIADYKLNEFVMNLTYATGFMSNTVPSGGSRVMIGTGKAEQRPQTRYIDTVKFFWEWFFKGPDHPDVQASLKRLNRLHAHLYRDYPESFDDNEDWIFTTCNLAVGADRMRQRVGASPQPEDVRTAWHHFWRDITDQMEGPHGPLHSFPETYRDMWAFAEEFEQRDRPDAPDGTLLCELMIKQFNERFFPRPLHGLGRTIVMAFVPPAVARRHKLPPANRLGVWLVHRAFRAMFFALDHFAPDNKVPMSEVLAGEKHQRWRKQNIARERANPLPPPPSRP
ncbi:oxygenase MpaB family protein [Streptomyces sp. NPDC005009]